MNILERQKLAAVRGEIAVTLRQIKLTVNNPVVNKTALKAQLEQTAKEIAKINNDILNVSWEPVSMDGE